MNFQSKTFFITIFLFLVVSLDAYANPQGANVVAGSATFTTTPNTLTVNTASNNTIINYNSFSIAANETTRFNQPSASSAVLNRVVGLDPSDIYGTLSSNGKLFLVNPNGILFGPNSKVNAPAILASTLDISNSDFLNGNYNFFKNGGSSYIINQGRLAASPGGYIALLSQAINNQGVIIAPLGSIALATGDKLTLALDSQSQISVAIDDAVKINAKGGKALLTKKALNDVFDHAVNNSGVIEASSLQDINSTGSLIAPDITLMSDGDIFSLGVLESSSLLERGNTFKVGGIFNPGYADIKNADDAITYSSDTNVSGIITDAGNIVVDPSVTLTMTADTSFEAGGAFTMDSTSTIAGGGYNLSISTLNASTLGNINNVNLLTLSLISGSTPVTFTSNSSSTFSVNTVKTNDLSVLSRSVGTGTSLDPIMIYSDSNAPGGLQYISTSGLGLYYEQANNIDASETSSWNSGAGFTPIGNSSTPFTGTFDGNNYTISNLFIDLPSTNYVGLFGYTSGSTISNIGLTNVNITGQDAVGGLAGASYYSSAISNSYTMGSVTGNTAGGLLGFNSSSSISNSYSTASVTDGSGGYTGGLVGFNDLSTITNSYATGSVTGGSGDYIGGLVGYNYNYATISNSYATGAVTGSSAVGGLVGWNDASASVSNSFATGSVIGGSNAGGLVGYNDAASISNSYATGAVIGNYDGGLVGTNYDSTISNSYATGAVTGTYDLGGLVGYDYGSSSIANSYATGTVTGSGSDVGGLIGYDDGTNTLTNNWWYNSLTYGIGSNGTAQSTGNWQLASGVSDFYGTGSGVGSLYSTWSFGVSGGWDSFTNTYPHLYWEWSPTITTLLQLQNINLDLNGSYTLGNDIDATGTEGWNSGAGFTPIGNSSTPFTGTFDGNNYTISNLFIDLPSTNYVGLFGYTSGSTISNIGLTNVNITGQDAVGGLAGASYYSSAISNSYTMGSVTGNTAGGLLGFNSSSSISNSYSTASVTDGSGGYTGGLVGFNDLSTITNSYATGSVTGGSGDYIGGLVGYNYNYATISNSYATGAVTGSSAVGGLVGWNDSYAGISNSFATGSVMGVNTGGLVGYNSYSSTISNSYATGAVIGNYDLGGLVGINYDSTIANTYATGAVTGNYDLGGLVGYDYGSSSIANSYATGSVTGSGSNIGGLIGYDDGSNTLTNNWWYNSLTYGIGSNGTAQSTGNWQKASGISDFYGSSFAVYTGATPWNFTSVWFPPSSAYPLLR